MEKIDLLREMLNDSSNIVFFGGAGVSTESGIPDFRSVDGLYSEHYDYPPETILSHSFFLRKPDIFYKFYRDKMIYRDAKPNAAHIALARLEEMGKLKAIITQNIDGLHQKAGSKEVLELHGSIRKNHCMKCGHFYDEHAILDTTGIPRCSCGGMIKPDVVLYEEGLDHKLMSKAAGYINNADVLLIAGTSLTVYPAAGLLDYYRGHRLVLINKSATSKDSFADLVIHEPVGETLKYCLDLVEASGMKERE